MHGHYPIFALLNGITLFSPSSMDITPFCRISDRLHGYYPILSHFRPHPRILPYFTLFPTVCTDITLVYPLFDRLLGYYPTFFMHLHRTSSLASHRPLTTTRDSLRQRPVPRSRPSRGGQSQQTTSLHSSANRTATVNV